MTDDQVRKAYRRTYGVDISHAWPHRADDFAAGYRAASEAASVAPEPLREAWRTAYSKVSKALAAMLNVPTPDKLFDLDAMPADPIKEQISRIRSAIDEFGKVLRSPT